MAEILHAQLTTWYGNDENKHDKVTFQLAADFDSDTYGLILL